MLKRVVVLLEQEEYSALLDLANDDLRNPGDELRHILRLEIEKRELSPKITVEGAENIAKTSDQTNL